MTPSPSAPALRAHPVLLVDDTLHFDLAGLSRACAADADELLALVDEGVLVPLPPGQPPWCFAGSSLPRALTALRLSRELDLGLHSLALVLDLLDRIAGLEARLARAGMR